jgi:uncharacterized protein YxjI
MMMNRFRQVVLPGAVLALLLIGAPAFAAEIFGKIEKIGEDNNSFILRADGKLFTFFLKANASIQLNDRQIKLGDAVRVEYDVENQKNFASEVEKRFESPAIGTIKKIDPKNNSFVLQIGQQEFTFFFKEGAEVRTGGKAVPVDTLKPGDVVRVEYEIERGRNYASEIEKKASP